MCVVECCQLRTEGSAANTGRCSPPGSLDARTHPCTHVRMHAQCMHKRDDTAQAPVVAVDLQLSWHVRIDGTTPLARRNGRRSRVGDGRKVARRQVHRLEHAQSVTGSRQRLGTAQIMSGYVMQT